MEKPLLIEPGVKYFVSGTLKECRRFKDRHMTLLFNVGMMLIFAGLVGGFLLYKYKGKLTPAEQAAKEQKKHEYIISKLYQLAYVKNTQNQNTITNLPPF